MKKKSTVLLFLVVLVLLLSGVVNGQKERVVSLPFWDTPGFIPYYWQAQHILAQGTIFEGLFSYAPDPKGLGGVKVVPAIAQSYTVSKDYKVWTFKLRRDKKWSNGDPITAKDFEWSFQYYSSTKIPDFPAWAGPLQYFENFWGVKSGALDPSKLGVRAIDNYTLEIRLSQPRYDMKELLCVAQGVPLHRKSVEADPQNWWRPGKIVVNGPFIPTAWTPGKDMTLVRNPNYVGERGNVDKLVLKFGGLGIQQYQAGELDAAMINNVAEYRFVLADPKFSKEYKEDVMDLFWQGYQISRGFDPVMDNKKLRQALAMAIDRDKLCKEVLSGRALPLAAYWPKGSPIGDKLKHIPYDVAKAKKLLAEAGYPNGKGLKTLTFYITGGGDPVVEFIVDQWKKNLGVNCIIENIESGVYTNSYMWANFTPEAKAGFTTIGAPMNNLEIGALFKNSDHTIWFYDYPGNVKKRINDLYQEYDAWLRKEGGTTEADWKPLLEKRNTLYANFQKILDNEPEKLWREELTRPPLWYEQFDELYSKWKTAKTAQEKTDYWRLAGRVLTDQENFQTQYTQSYPSRNQAYRWRLRAVNRPFSEAVKIAHYSLQIMQDQYWMVPVYLAKAQWVQNPKLDGLMLYKFSWGPGFFNFKYLNLKD
ncbi:MAG: peptide ABC transporter substrate-binding protein [Dictyoglomaceae bacterium]|nr:peptide ABC transporter substrate-binding protein [Dictyoglomaceae bacterium]HPU43564.1 peptide ABC transporter substrate-binding protein [Dictyoglomaceae bacterium]